MIVLHLLGRMRSGKNQMQITRTGHHYPKPEFVAWRNEMTKQIYQQIGKPKPIARPTAVSICYYPGDAIRRDAPGIVDALWHLFEHCGLVTDDYLFQEVNYKQMEIDREKPRCSIEFSDIVPTGLV